MSTAKGVGRRPKTRGSTHPGRDKPPGRGGDALGGTRATSASGADLLDDHAEDELAAPLRVVVLETAAHLTAAQAAIAVSGHGVVAAATPRDGDRLVAALELADAMLVGIPGGEPLIEAARALGPRRPIVIAASTASAPEAVRRAVQIGADLATARPHDAERLAPVLFAASRLVERPRPAHGAAVAALIEETEGVIEETHGVTDRAIDDMLDELSDLEPAGFVPLAAFDQRAAAELERAGRYGYPLAVALCSLENTEPPPELRGLLRARAGNALVHAVRDIDLATELGDDRFLVLMPYTDRALAAEVARRVLAAVADGDPVVAAGRSFPLRLVGAVAATRPADRRGFPQLVHDVTQLLEQALATGASLAVET